MKGFLIQEFNTQISYKIHQVPTIEKSVSETNNVFLRENLAGSEFAVQRE